MARKTFTGASRQTHRAARQSADFIAPSGAVATIRALALWGVDEVCRMLVRILGASALAAVAFVVGCSTSDGARENAGATASAIQGGTTDTTHTYAIGVCVGSGPRQC